MSFKGDSSRSGVYDSISNLEASIGRPFEWPRKSKAKSSNPVR